MHTRFIFAVVTASLMAVPAYAAAPQQAGVANTPITLQPPARALVHAKSAPVWSEPRNGSRKVETVFAGTGVDILGTEGAWTHVHTGRHSGWISSNLLRPGA